MSYISMYINEAKDILDKIDQSQIEAMIALLLDIREKQGRLFFLGVGGSAGNCSHAVNDFRKIGGIEAYAPTDNVPELTARTNDEGWETVFEGFLQTSRVREGDGVFVFSVGGGDAERNISANIVRGLKLAKARGAKVMGVVSRNGGYTAQVADACVVVPVVNPDTVTPHAESFQGLIWHLIVSDPRIMTMKNKWESVSAK
ncbi:MAG: SIS domain-containing protein [Pseudodesulfovibrio sp.]